MQRGLAIETAWSDGLGSELAVWGPRGREGLSRGGPVVGGYSLKSEHGMVSL